MCHTQGFWYGGPGLFSIFTLLMTHRGGNRRTSRPDVPPTSQLRCLCFKHAEAVVQKLGQLLCSTEEWAELLPHTKAKNAGRAGKRAFIHVCVRVALVQLYPTVVLHWSWHTGQDEFCRVTLNPAAQHICLNIVPIRARNSLHEPPHHSFNLWGSFPGASL